MRIIKIFIISFVAGNMLFCAGQKKIVQQHEKPEKIKANPELIEDFDPMTLGDYDFQISSKSQGETGVLDIDKFLQGGKNNDSSRVEEKVPGYRVQIISTRDEAEARAVKRDALFIFDEGVYLTFDDPYYKVRVGDAVSRFDANDLQEVAVSKGYLEAWVVRSEVYSNPQKRMQEAEQGGDNNENSTGP
ncbi:MAG: hypothetical protein GWP06_03120 [Actinobacteria bacterium]|nr:hypothetical protein [Actinomycetota bacterium]